MSYRRRAAEHILLDGKNLSVSSQDGGDEYSSEASELDNTRNVRLKFSKVLLVLPLWELVVSC
jgi:hypothetical protein